MRGEPLGLLHGLPLGVKDLLDTRRHCVAWSACDHRPAWANHVRPLGWSLISVFGPMGRDVADTHLMLQACAGINPRYPSSYAEPLLAAPLAPVDVSQLRIGFTEDFGLCPVDPAIRRVMRQRVQALGVLVARCEPVTLDVGDADRVFDILRAESFYAGYADMIRDAPETLAPHVRANIEMVGSMTLADRAWAHLAQTRLALPCGLDEAGMPFGLQLIGPLRGDAKLLAMAAALEQAFAADPALRRPKPDLQALQTPQPELRSIVTHLPILTNGS